MKRSVTDLFEGAELDESDAKRARAQWPACVPTPAAHRDFCYDPDADDGAPEPAAEPLPRKAPEDPDMTAREFYNAYVHRTEEQCAAEAAAPQRSAEWKAARRFALTASDFGTAAGSNPYCTPDDLVRRKLWESFCGNAATRWGSAHEDHAAEAFLEWARANVSPDAELVHLNLLKWPDMPWLGVSPDGILVWRDGDALVADLVEFKCPTRTTTMDHPYAKYPLCTPPYYRHQMLGIWALINLHGGLTLEFQGAPAHITALRCAWFVVWQPSTLWVVRHDFSLDDWTAELYPRVRAWYFAKYLPALTWHYNLRLEHGDIAPASVPLDLACDVESK